MVRDELKLVYNLINFMKHSNMKNIRDFILEIRYYLQFIIGEILKNRYFNILMKMVTISSDRL